MKDIVININIVATLRRLRWVLGAAAWIMFLVSLCGPIEANRHPNEIMGGSNLPLVIILIFLVAAPFENLAIATWATQLIMVREMEWG